MAARPFFASELTTPTRVRRDIVCTPELAGFRGNTADCVEWARRSREAIRNAVHENGAILLRGFPLHEPEDFDAVMRTLGFDLDAEYWGGATPRKRVTDKTWSSTEVPSSMIIPYHTEMCYLRRRPKYVSFYCSVPPKRYGETVLFDGETAWNGLPEFVRSQLRDVGLMYRRHFLDRRKRGARNYHMLWREAFRVEDRAELEERLREDGTEFEWHDDGSLTTTLRVPAVLRHEPTGRPCLSITTYDDFSMVHNIDRFAKRYGLAQRAVMRWFYKSLFANNETVPLYTLYGDGRRFTREESSAIQAATWRASILFVWQKGDLLLIDNIRMGHGKMNVVRPRRIVAALCDLYDVGELPAAS